MDLKKNLVDMSNKMSSDNVALIEFHYFINTIVPCFNDLNKKCLLLTFQCTLLHLKTCIYVLAFQIVSQYMCNKNQC